MPTPLENSSAKVAATPLNAVKTNNVQPAIATGVRADDIGSKTVANLSPTAKLGQAAFQMIAAMAA